MLFPFNHFRRSWHGAPASDVSTVDTLIQKTFRDVLPWGLGADIDLLNCDPLHICDVDVIRGFLTDLGDKLGEPHLGDPLLLAHLGPSNLALTQQCGTCVIWGSFLGPDAAVCFHIFSGKPYPPYSVAVLGQQWFAARDVNISVLFRGPYKAAFGYLFAEEGEKH
jgi:hypothetical protein